MKVAEYLVEALKKKGVTDVFGIPGGVIIDLLYAFDSSEITPHLSYHEQAAALEACGYAQVNYSLAVAYATRGPGFTNLITGIAEAYAESLPVLFITGHSGMAVSHEQRFEKEQEMDTLQMVQHITKYAASIDSIEEAVEKIDEAIEIALYGRKGPVFLDFSSSLWNKEIVVDDKKDESNNSDSTLDIHLLNKLLNYSKRPVLLLGDGIKQSGCGKELLTQLGNVRIPVLSSRGAQDLKSFFPNYYGYVGSHGIRYANAIFAKADLVIAIGNRLAFPLNSVSFNKSLLNKQIIRFDIDCSEIKRKLQNTTSYICDANQAVRAVALALREYDCFEWVAACSSIKEALRDYDTNNSIIFLQKLFNKLNPQYIVADVGNNEFWTSHAYEIAECEGRVLYSKSFGVLGCGVGKSIGAYYRAGEAVMLITGDQGMQLNIQELQLIIKEQLPIQIVIINNNASAMIKDREEKKDYYLHTTIESGYGNPDYSRIAKAYGIPFARISTIEELDVNSISKPMIIEYVCSDTKLEPKLLLGDSIDDMYPKIDESLLLKIRSI